MRPALLAPLALVMLLAPSCARDTVRVEPTAGHARKGPMACESLTKLALPHAAITEARLVAADGATPAHCRVVGSSHPTADSDIGFAVVIPLGAAWNGRYVQAGNGGFAGSLPDEDLRGWLATGSAVAGTDDGHRSTDSADARWALGHREKLVDFGHRALKETTDAARAVIAAFTGRAPRYSYFCGCSDGGREALMEVQRYPDDFDGVVAGAPANEATRLLLAMAWNAAALERTPASYVPRAKLPAIEAAALAACGDGDGVVEDPLACRFDPAVLRCAGAETDACLVDAQVAALRAIYDGPRSPTTQARLYPGIEPGAEAEPGGWGMAIVGASAGDAGGAAARALASNFFRYMVKGDEGFDLARIDLDADAARIDAELAPILDATDPDLRRFAAHGKLIQLHGWSDPMIPPRASIAYFDRVQATMGETRAFYRLFLAPGMLHCTGGRGPHAIEAFDAITAWVERDVAPDRLVATKYVDDDRAKGVARTRPLCPYPARAKWDGRGDRARAESYRCASED